MKTILYNPIFINPQAYYVFPRLTRYLQPDNESTAEPANYIGTIEVKVIAYGDTTLKRTYTNTDSIDLSEFKNTWIRISLFTKVGSCVLGEWKIGNMESDLPYIDPEVLASLKAVVIVGNKTNNDSDRAIVKNLVDPDNPFVISNAAYTEGSGVNEDGSYQFDGVDDFVTIPTLSSGGKQVLMKVNWDKTIADAILYDQRGYPNEFAIYNADVDNNNNPVFAYQARNNGQTYIDGILNKNIKASELRAITHNITITNELSTGTNTSSPVIGSNRVRDAYFTKMALYDFMLFDNISTDDKIKELNEYVGIEAKVELPPYYWDAYGKTNLDEDKATIQQRGVAIGDYDLINNNFAYEGMSGYNGYPAVFGTNKTYANLVPNDGNFILTSSHNIINVTKFDTSYGLLYSHIKLDGKLTSRNIDYPSYKIKVTGLGENFGLHYSYLESSSDTTVKGFEINNDGIYIIPKSFASDGSLTSNSDWIGFIFTGTAPESCNVTIEVLPEYENGLVYDGVTDYSENANIPAFTDYTYIFKRTLLNKKYNSASVFKGSNQQSGGGAFICDYNSVEPELMIQGYSFGAGLYANSLNTNDIVYGTKNSVNGAIIVPGNNADVEGLAVGKWRAYRQMVFYKLILYPKTISLLQINFLKNLMERDEIIDLTNPIFIQE